MFEVIHYIRTRVILVRHDGGAGGDDGVMVRNLQARTRGPARVWVWRRAGARMGACNGVTRPGSGGCRTAGRMSAGPGAPGRRAWPAAGAGRDAGSGRAAGGCWGRGCGGGRVALLGLLVVGLGSGGRVRWCGGEVRSVPLCQRLVGGSRWEGQPYGRRGYAGALRR